MAVGEATSILKKKKRKEICNFLLGKSRFVGRRFSSPRL